MVAALGALQRFLMGSLASYGMRGDGVGDLRGYTVLTCDPVIMAAGH